MGKRNVFKDDGMSVLLDALLGNNPGREIEASEARGQASFVKSDVLPAAMEPEYRKILEDAGVVFGDIVPDDDLFRYVTLPEGWHKEPTDHNMWSELRDEKDRVRAMIFYKAAFYDRRADLRCERRFGYHKEDA